MNRPSVAAKGISFRAKTTLRLFLAVLKRARDAGVTLGQAEALSWTYKVRQM